MIQKNRLVMITGATRGLGLLVARKFWNAGHDLIILSRSGPDLERVSADFRERCIKGQKIHPYLFDLKNIDSFRTAQGLSDRHP